MDTNYEMSYYNYGITLSAEGVVPSFKPQEGGKDSNKYVDLGLPSGTLWATENIKDADGNELYFAWGETHGYTLEQVGTDKNFTWNDYEFGTSDNLSKYNNSDGKTELDAEDDAATANLGSDWKMPTKEQFEELIANTTTAWTQVDGVNGLLCTSTANTNTLFFPAVGDADYGQVNDVGDYGYYWSVSLYVKNVTDAYMFSLGNGQYVDATVRHYGLSVRHVRSNS